MADPFDAAAVQSLLKAGDARAAVELINQWLEREPHNVDSLYHLAVAYRYSDEHNHALEAVKQLQPLAKFGRGHQEAGYIHLALRQPEQALQAFNRAVVLNDSLLASWRTIIKLCIRPEHADCVARVVAIRPWQPATSLALRSQRHRRGQSTQSRGHL